MDVFLDNRDYERKNAFHSIKGINEDGNSSGWDGAATKIILPLQAM